MNQGRRKIEKIIAAVLAIITLLQPLVPINANASEVVEKDDSNYYTAAEIIDYEPDEEYETDEELPELKVDEDGWSYFDGFIVTNGPAGRTSSGQVRGNSSLMSNATYNSSHINLPAPGRGMAWGVDNWEIWISGTGWQTAFCLQPGVPSAMAGQQLGGWNSSSNAWAGLSGAQRRTIEYILQFGYGYFHEVGGSATNNDSIIVTQVAIWEVVLGLWTYNTAWNGWAQRNSPNSNAWHFNERLIRESGTASGWNGYMLNGFDGRIHNHTRPIGSSARVNRYNRLRLDINDFVRRQVVPQFASSTTNESEREQNIHQLTWHSGRGRYEVTLSDTTNNGGNMVLTRFLNKAVGAPSIAFRTGLRAERTGNNTIRIYATSATNPPTGRHTSTNNLMRIRQGREMPTTWHHHPNLQDKITGNTAANSINAFITVEVVQRPALVQATKLSNRTGNPIPGTVFEIQRRNPANDGWNPVAGSQTLSTNQSGVALFEDLTPGRRYRIREISVPAPYIVDTTWREFYAVAGQTINQRFYNYQATGEIIVTKYSASTGDTIPGTIFRLTGNGITREATTGASGQAIFNNLPLAANSVTYTIEEIFVPAPYILPANSNARIQTVSLSRVNQTTAVTRTSRSFTNVAAMGYFQILKQDAVTGNTPQGEAQLAGAVFHIYAAQNIVRSNGSIIYPAGTRVDRVVIENDHRVRTRNLPLGHYRIQEVVPGRGYNLNPNRYYVELRYVNQNTPVVTSQQRINNEVIEGRVEIIKIGEVPALRQALLWTRDLLRGQIQTNAQNRNLRPPLAGVEFTFFDYNDIIVVV